MSTAKTHQQSPTEPSHCQQMRLITEPLLCMNVSPNSNSTVFHDDCALKTELGDMKHRFVSKSHAPFPMSMNIWSLTLARDSSGKVQSSRVQRADIWLATARDSVQRKGNGLERIHLVNVSFFCWKNQLENFLEYETLSNVWWNFLHILHILMENIQKFWNFSKCFIF